MQMDSSKQRHAASEPTKPELLIDQIAQMTLTSLSGIVTLEGGEFGVDCFHTTAILPYMGFGEE